VKLSWFEIGEEGSNAAGSDAAVTALLLFLSHVVKLEKSYVFDGPNGKASLNDLFEGRRQLIVYHFMFDPTWDKGCPGCTGLVNSFGDLSLLNKRDTTFAVVSRAPLAKLEAYKVEKGWDIPTKVFGQGFVADFRVLAWQIGPLPNKVRFWRHFFDRRPGSEH
jgi:predicted dithiol-disulfide oxidoreductase (DUF899 family)